LDKEFFLIVLDRALGISRPEIFNSDQGEQLRLHSSFFPASRWQWFFLEVLR
jgi:hypothetical protein